MKATIFTGWIYNHLLPHAAQVKVAHPLMLRAIAAAKRRMIGWVPARLPTAAPNGFGTGSEHRLNLR